MQTLTKFQIAPQGENFVMQLEDDGGGRMAVEVTPEQLDALVELADDLLAADDDAFAVDEADDDD